MKLLFVALIVSIMVVSTEADRMIRVAFNNGISPTQETLCSNSDDAHIDKVFQPIKRYLRQATGKMANSTVESSDIDSSEMIVDRELYPAYCKNNCAGWAAGTCRATNCIGYRKKNRRQAAQGGESLTCADHLEMVRLELNDAMAKVSSTCAAFMNPSNRKMECFDDVIYGVVESFSLWKAPAVPAVPAWKPKYALGMPSDIANSALKAVGTVTEGFQVCTTDRIDIEAVVNPCVKFINSTLVGPNGYNAARTESQVPYTVFGNDQNKLLGKSLMTVGTYTFTAVPDGFAHKTKSITFNVVRCF